MAKPATVLTRALLCLAASPWLQPAMAQPGRSCEAAVELSVDAPVGGSLPGGEHASYWYAFNAQARHLYRVAFKPHVSPDTIEVAPSVILHRADCGEEVAGLFSIASDYAIPLRFAHDERVLLEARSFELTPIPQSFTVILHDLGPSRDEAPDFVPDVSADFTPLNHLSGRIDHAGDVDRYRVRLNERTFYRFSFRYKSRFAPEVSRSAFDRLGTYAGFSHFDPSLWSYYEIDAYDERAEVLESAFIVRAGDGGEFLLTIGAPWLNNVGEYELILLEQTSLPPPLAPGEPGFSCDTPLPLRVGEEAPLPALGDADDARWFAIELQAGHAYHIGGQLYEPDCRSLVAESPFPTAAFGSPPSNVRIEHDGLYFFKAIPALKRYEPASVTDLGPAGDDAPSQRSRALDRWPDEPAAGAIDYPYDVDFYRLHLAPGGIYRARMHVQPSYQFDYYYPIGAVFESTGDPFGVQLSPPSIYAPRFREFASVLLNVPPDTDGIVPLCVYSDSSYLYGPTPTYDIALERLDDPDHPLPIHNTCEDPILLTLGEPIANRLAGPGYAYYAMPTTAGERYRVRITQISSADRYSSVPAVIVAPDCATIIDTLSRDWRTGQGLAEFVAHETGLHVLRVGSPDFPQPIAYTLIIDDRGPGVDDVGSTLACATPVDPEHADITSSIAFPTDTDIFTFDLVPGAAYEFTLESLTPGLGVYAWLANSGPFSGYRLLADLIATRQADAQNTPDPVRFIAPPAQFLPAFLTVGGFNLSDSIDDPPLPGAYRFTLRRVACPSDLNHDGLTTPDDLADYIAAYFALPPAPAADFNADGAVDPDDIADYIAAYFAGC